MTNNEIMKGWDNLHDRRWAISKNGEFIRMGDVVDFINRQQAEIERLEQNLKEAHIDIKEHRAEIERLTERNFELAKKGEAVCIAYKTAKAEAIKEFAEKVDEILKRYAHLHKYAEKARHSTEEYADGTPMEMVSVWEVLSLKKWEMCDYETMSTLQDNIETIEKARLLSELEKDFMLLKKRNGR